VAGPFAGADPVGEDPHPGEHVVNAGNDIVPVDLDDRREGGAQGDVQHRAVLSCVDLLAAEHRVPELGHPDGGCEFAQQFQGLVGDEVLGVVDVQITDLERVTAGALRVGGEQLTQVGIRELVTVLAERVPLGALVESGGRVALRMCFGHQSTPRRAGCSSKLIDSSPE
jgi:hypothetical protein